jgi:hypothetical protein
MLFTEPVNSFDALPFFSNNRALSLLAAPSRKTVPAPDIFSASMVSEVAALAGSSTAGSVKRMAMGTITGNKSLRPHALRVLSLVAISLTSHFRLR